MTTHYRSAGLLARDIRIARRRGNVVVEEYLRNKRREQRYPDPDMRRDGYITVSSPAVHGHVAAAPSLEDYDHGGGGDE